MIIDPVEEMKKAIPKLTEIGHAPNNLEYVRDNNFSVRLTRIEKHNLRKYKRSLTACSMRAYFNPCILEYNGNSILINKAMYKLIADYLRSDEFNLRRA